MSTEPKGSTAKEGKDMTRFEKKAKFEAAIAAKKADLEHFKKMCKLHRAAGWKTEAENDMVFIEWIMEELNTNLLNFLTEA